MTEPSLKTTQLGQLRLSIYDFLSVGSVLPAHVHTTPEANHVSIVARGSFVCHGDDGIEGRIIKGGDVVDWPLSAAHGFEALEADSRLINIPRVMRVQP